MSKLRELAVDSDAFQQMVASLLPRGPIWVPRNADIAALSAGLGDEGVRFHNRMVELMLEAYPSTTDELLDEWEDAYGLPLCGDAPTDLASRQAALAGRVAAVGGQTPEYFIGLAWAVLEQSGYSRTTDPDLVTIEERPEGVPFRVSEGRVGDRLGAVEALFDWVMHLPTDTPTDFGHVIECIVERYAPAHTNVTFEYDTTP